MQVDASLWEFVVRPDKIALRISVMTTESFIDVVACVLRKTVMTLTDIQLQLRGKK